MTTYYFTKTNAANQVIATDGVKYFECFVDSNGVDITSGVNLYVKTGDIFDDDHKEELKAKIEELKNAYKNVDGLYNMDDIEMDFPDSVYDVVGDDFFDFCEEMVEIITVE